jgi:hypothetical protein
MARRFRVFQSDSRHFKVIQRFLENHFLFLKWVTFVMIVRQDLCDLGDSVAKIVALMQSVTASHG